MAKKRNSTARMLITGYVLPRTAQKHRGVMIEGTPYRYTMPYGMRRGMVSTGDGVADVNPQGIVGGLQIMHEPVTLWWQGLCVCRSCGHEWRMVCETTWNGTTPDDGFECPGCGEMDGTCD